MQDERPTLTLDVNPAFAAATKAFFGDHKPEKWEFERFAARWQAENPSASLVARPQVTPE